MSRPRFVFLLGSAQRRLQQWMAAEQARGALQGLRSPSPVQGGLLFILTRKDGVTMGEIAQQLDLAPSAVSGLVQRMEAQAWLTRRACELDARTQRVWLTEEGRAQMPALRKALGHINERLTQSFTEAELQTVARWLEHVQNLGVNEDE